jgi:UDP-N-acetylglucosamine 4,6-dehydratase
MKALGNSKVLITGGTGTLGNALIEELRRLGACLAVYSRDEKKQSDLEQLYPDVFMYLGDVRDRGRFGDVCRNFRPDWIIHAAALKQVCACEDSPGECLHTNVIGTRNVAGNAAQVGAELLFVSTDKAVYPINTYGMSKALAEKIVTDAGGRVIRYGNVLNSRGSVIEKWIGRIMGGHEDVFAVDDHIRYWLLKEQAVAAICEAMTCQDDVRLFVPSMRALGIKALAVCFAKAMKNVANKDVRITPAVPLCGEKRIEYILTNEEQEESEYKPYRVLNSSAIIKAQHGEPENDSNNCFIAPKWYHSEMEKILGNIIEKEMMHRSK